MPNVRQSIRPRRLQAQPDVASRFAVHASARPVIQRALAELPQEVSVDALTAAYDAWLEGTVATTVADGIATIPVRGVLTKGFSFWNYWFGWSSYDQIAHDLDVALADASVRGIVLSVDSPGGQVDGVAELAARIRSAQAVGAGKPIVAHVDGLAASAGYWVASAAERVVLAPTAMAGSIGVVFSFVDYAGAYEQAGIRETEIVSTQSPRKRPNPFEAEGRAQYQAHADTIAEVFLEAVATQRRTTRDVVAAQFGQGDVFVGQGAIDAGLADALGTFDETRRALDARLTATAAELFTVVVPRSELRADRARALAAITAAVDAACDTSTEDLPMAGKQPVPRSARSAAATAAEDDEEDKTPAPDVPPIEEDEEPSVEEDQQDEDEKPTPDSATDAPSDEEEEDDEEVVALTRSHGAVLARVRQRAAATERVRIAGIRAIARPGQETVVQACVDDASCTVERAALSLLQHEKGQRTAHLRGVRAEEDALTPPDNSAAPDARGEAGVVGSIVALLNANTTRRSSAAGRI